MSRNIEIEEKVSSDNTMAGTTILLFDINMYYIYNFSLSTHICIEVNDEFMFTFPVIILNILKLIHSKIEIID